QRLMQTLQWIEAIRAFFSTDVHVRNLRQDKARAQTARLRVDLFIRQPFLPADPASLGATADLSVPLVTLKAGTRVSRSIHRARDAEAECGTAERRGGGAPRRRPQGGCSVNVRAAAIDMARAIVRLHRCAIDRRKIVGRRIAILDPFGGVAVQIE